ncbi:MULTISPECIES: biotin transporter BioY [Nocardiopsis]|uniref:Biotin transporter n=1 Tax=Nocardiopsis sinuspersici TaxID=501010 RepID=A0A1V3BWU5_9ACTN|nr:MULTISPECIES: biotin transporter BioY [Nocardiopsis]NYH53940.1 biotin transport system substrate-specific component [Nocardiopsis sinuspersici]OOC52842.1 BioY protein [Nocardiopsis sinuspersici]
MPTTRNVVRHKGLTARDLALIAVFAGLIAALSVAVAIPLPFSPVPITLQTLGIMLAPSLLGWKRGTLAVAAFLALGLAGLPLFAGGMGGVGVLARPSAGFIVSWIFAALVIGVLTDLLVRGNHGRYRFWAGLGINVVGGILVIYAIGVPWMAVVAGSGVLATTYSMLAFLPGDLVKAVVTALIASTVFRAYPIPPAGHPVVEVDEGKGGAA